MCPVPNKTTCRSLNYSQKHGTFHAPVKYFNSKKNIIHIHYNNLVSVSGFWDLLLCDNYSLLFAFFWFVTQYAVWWRSPAVCFDLRCSVLCPWFDLQCQSMRSQMSGCWIVAAATTRRMTTWTQKFSSLSNVYIHPIKIRQDLL